MTTTDCQIHPGRPNNKGYVARWYDGRLEQVHRIAWIKAHGPIPSGQEVDHQCGTRNCVNVDHLRLLTHRENLLAGDTLAAKNAAKTHCPKGHPYDAANTYTTRAGKRQCRACSRARKRARK
jgi:hypothetical protein